MIIVMIANLEVAWKSSTSAHPTPDRSTWDATVDLGALASLLHDTIVAHWVDGFTFNPHTRALQEFDRKTYIVSIRGYETKLVAAPTVLEVERWLWRAVRLLGRPRHYVGGWRNGHYYLDVSIPVKGLRRALIMGRAHHQRSIFHPATGREIRVHNSSLPAIDQDVSVERGAGVFLPARSMR